LAAKDGKPEDQAIATALAAGDADAAISLLMDRYGERIYRYCRRMVGSEARDVSQVVFVHALEALRRGAAVENPHGWLRGIARHRCLDHLDKLRRAPVPIASDELERAAEADSGWEIGSPDLRSRRHLDECLDQLEASKRTAVLFRFYDQLSYDAIAKITGASVGALRVRVARALRALRKCMERKAGKP
jgi:RNA polymerase sigma-70 factor (ECF subfamily)